MLRLLPALLALSGCASAARPAAVGGAWEGAFEVEAPEEWSVTRNYRWMGNSLFTVTSPDRASAITIELIREGRRSRELPLSLVSEALALESGRVMGIESGRLAQHEIVIDDREAWVTTARRTHGPNERLASVAVLRYDRYLTILTLHTLPEASLQVALGWERVLQSFDLPGPEAPPGGVPVLFDTDDPRGDGSPEARAR